VFVVGHVEVADVAPQTPDAERELVERALSKDRRALVELARRLTPTIQVRVARALAKRSSGRSRELRADVDDLTQEVFVRLFTNDGRALRAWDPSRGLSLESFAGMVAEREVSNVLVSARRTPRNEKERPTEDVEVYAVQTDGERRVVYRDLLRELCLRLDVWLTPRGRELFDQVYLEEVPLQEVAASFEMKPSALYAWRNRVANRARELFDELVSEDERKMPEASER
jgi:RNA polymerase sigma factor (sigma-70 family)